MGRYVNPGNRNYAGVVKSGIYVDKTRMLAHLNQLMDTEQRWICVSRPRRFGKTLAVDMAVAYYSRNCASDELFRGKAIETDASYKQYLNQCNVIKWDMAEAITVYGSPQKALDGILRDTIRELTKVFPEALSGSDPERPLAMVMWDVYDALDETFVFLIDEWDALYRESDDAELQTCYTNLLRGLFKGSSAKEFIRLAYLTGILPIKRCNSESALNNFMEYTMTGSFDLAPYVGFTDSEVRELCDERGMDFGRMRRMYDGYSFHKARHIYCPNSVVRAIMNRDYRCYWTQTSSYEIVRTYISMDYQGLKGDIAAMLAGGRCRVDVYRFENDMKVVRSRDDVLTVLIHLGYLAYDEETSEAYVPNEDVRSALKRVITDVSWTPVIQAIETSDRLLAALLRKDGDAVAAGVEKAHQDHASLWKYNEENTLACVVRLAFYNAINEYEIFSEMPVGVGRADLVPRAAAASGTHPEENFAKANSPMGSRLAATAAMSEIGVLPSGRSSYLVFLPVRGSDKPALVIELKNGESAESAIDQIKSRRYPASLERYAGQILLAGISYDRDDPEKKHTCVIEEWEKEQVHRAY